MTYHWIVDKSNTTGAKSGTRTGLNKYLLALSEHEISQLGFCGIPVAQFVAFCVVFCRSWFDVFPLSIDRCVVGPSSSYAIILLPLVSWYLQTSLIMVISDVYYNNTILYLYLAILLFYFHLQVLPEGKSGHTHVLSKRQVWMSIFHTSYIILLSFIIHI
jgi:hypothetical protein